MEERKDSPADKLRHDPKGIWIEVLAMYGLALGVIGLFKVLSLFSGFLADNLWGIAGLVFLFLPIEYLSRKGVDLERYGLTWKHLGRAFLWAGLFVVITFPPYVPAFVWWFGRGEFHFDLPDTFWQEVVGFFFLVALPEEAFYRGYMQTRLDEVFKGRVNILGAKVGWSLVVTSALFAIGHLITPRLDKLGTFFPALLFGWMRARTGTIAAAVIFHALCNIYAQVLKYGYF
ncbi:MAG: CPBP family intramembrane metalloprotease [Deltaproteobacteria bacterium]|nr:CPBP family intramembrane metalloprotease [Deltaproteobacteria bacterium]